MWEALNFIALLIFVDYVVIAALFFFVGIVSLFAEGTSLLPDLRSSLRPCVVEGRCDGGRAHRFFERALWSIDVWFGSAGLILALGLIIFVLSAGFPILAWLAREEF